MKFRAPRFVAGKLSLKQALSAFAQARCLASYMGENCVAAMKFEISGFYLYTRYFNVARVLGQAALISLYVECAREQRYLAYKVFTTPGAFSSSD